MFNGILIGDTELENYEKEIVGTENKFNENEPVVYGGIKINPKEAELLCLPPDHTIYPKIDLEEFDTDMEKCIIKCTWEAVREQRKVEENKVMEEVSGESVKNQNYENYDKFYDPKKKSLNFRNLKPTDFKYNKRVIIADPEDDLEEIRRNNLKNELRQVVVEYKKEHCEKFGNIRENNLSESQLKDIKKLKNRMKNEGLAGGETDKTGKLTLDTLENISKKMNKHIKDDKVLGDKEFRRLESTVNRHMVFWVKMLKPIWGNRRN